MSILTDSYSLNTGAQIPKIGFGTWQIPDGDDAYNSVLTALKHGYRHIDTALVYGNEESVGRAIKDSGIERGELFITTKLPAQIKNPADVQANFDRSMTLLDLEYVNLYLIHAPWPWTEQGTDYTKENILVWKEMEKIYKSGRAKAIGVSNFNVKDLQAILDTGEIVPAVNQIRFFIGNTQEEVTVFCQEHAILVEAYSPLATGRLLENETLIAMAEKYSKTVAQLSIRYTLQRGTLPLPKSTHEEYIIQNAEVDFEISDADMDVLDTLSMS